MRKVFIDSNIYLGFYNGVMENSIELFNKFVELLEKGKVKLVITQQTINEIERKKISCRHKAWKLSQELENRLMSTTKDLKTTDFENVSIESYRDKMKDFSKQLTRDIKTNVKEGGKVDQIIFRLISLSEVIQTSPAILKRAETRVRLGNPPKKGASDGSSLGDAVNWEIILEYTKDDLIIVSKDMDFFDKDWDDELVLNLFLQNEWKVKKKNITAIENFAKLMEEISQENPGINKRSIKKALQEERSIYIDGEKDKKGKFPFGDFDLDNYPNLKEALLQEYIKEKNLSGYHQNLVDQYTPNLEDVEEIEKRSGYISI